MTEEILKTVAKEVIVTEEMKEAGAAEMEAFLDGFGCSIAPQLAQDIFFIMLRKGGFIEASSKE